MQKGLGKARAEKARRAHTGGRARRLRRHTMQGAPLSRHRTTARHEILKCMERAHTALGHLQWRNCRPGMLQLKTQLTLNGGPRMGKWGHIGAGSQTRATHTVRVGRRCYTIMVGRAQQRQLALHGCMGRRFPRNNHKTGTRGERAHSSREHAHIGIYVLAVCLAKDARYGLEHNHGKTRRHPSMATNTPPQKPAPGCARRLPALRRATGRAAKVPRRAARARLHGGFAPPHIQIHSRCVRKRYRPTYVCMCGCGGGVARAHHSDPASKPNLGIFASLTQTATHLPMDGPCWEPLGAWTRY